MSPKATATLDGKVIAEATSWETVEGNIYFPPSSIDKSVLKNSDLTTHCYWKGDASYYTLSVNGKDYKDAAWYYASPLEKATNIKDHVAFYKNKVKIESS